MHGSPRIDQRQQDADDQHSKRGCEYDNGAFESRDSEAMDEPGKKEVSCLPLADSLLAYKIDNYGSKAALVDPQIKSAVEPTCVGIEDPNVSTDDVIFAEPKSFLVNRIVIGKKLSKGVQAWPTPPYRLKVIPRRRKCGNSKFGFLGQWAFCQLGLGSLLLIWALAGATAFRYTEGPSEEMAAEELVTKQRHLVDGLTKELKEEIDRENNWYKTIEKYMYQHEQVLAEIGSRGQGASGGNVWTFPGCVLFAVSLITTLGFGAPVPRTSEGRGVAVAFAAIGIPLHLLLVLNIGMAIAIKLQKYSSKKKSTDKESQDEFHEETLQRDDNIVEPSSKHNGIFSVSRHRRSGSEPIGRQAISNITTQANLMCEDSKDVKYIHITEPNLKHSVVDIDKECQTVASSTNPVFHMDHTNQPPNTPKWLKWFPFISIVVYYSFGFLVFGIARYQPLLKSLMFPLDFTVAGGVAQTAGYIRVLYAIYLEGAVVLAAVTVAILQVSATQGLTNLGLRYGLLTNSR